MSRDASERERLKALVRGERVIGHEALAPRPVELSEYEAPILEALAERGGRASRAEVLAFVKKAMSDRHGTTDLEVLPSGTRRWEARVGKARQGLVRRRLLDAVDTRVGVAAYCPCTGLTPSSSSLTKGHLRDDGNARVCIPH